MKEGKAETIISRIQKGFLALAIFYSLDALLSGEELRETLESLLSALTFALVYVGLRGRKDWAVDLVLFSSAFSCYLNLFHLLVLAQGAGMIAAKVLNGLLLLFFCYQLAFFTKQEVRRLFGAQGFVVF